MLSALFELQIYQKVSFAKFMTKLVFRCSIEKLSLLERETLLDSTRLVAAEEAALKKREKTIQNHQNSKLITCENCCLENLKRAKSVMLLVSAVFRASSMMLLGKNGASSEEPVGCC